MGTNIYASRFGGLLYLSDCNLSSFTNSIYLEEGFDLETHNLVLTAEPNQIVSMVSYALYDYTMVMNNSTAKSELDAIPEDALEEIPIWEEEEEEDPYAYY